MLEKKIDEPKKSNKNIIKVYNQIQFENNNEKPKFFLKKMKNFLEHLRSPDRVCSLS